MPAPESRRPENYPALARLTGIELQAWVRDLADPVAGCGLRGLHCAGSMWFG